MGDIDVPRLARALVALALAAAADGLSRVALRLARGAARRNAVRDPNEFLCRSHRLWR